MLVLLQKKEKSNPLSTEEFLVRQMIVQTRNEYIPVEYEELFYKGKLMGINSFPKYWQDAIPIGSLEFVGGWLSIFKDCRMNPIEIPKCLRTEEFLKREYYIRHSDGMPETGRWFVKDASMLKSFSWIMDKKQFEYAASNEYMKKYMAESKDNPYMPAPPDMSHLFVFSEYVDDIYAEYRAYFINGNLENLCNYNGYYDYQPDIKLIMKADALYSMQPDYPKSYTMDVMVSGRGTAIIEIHPFACIGLYSTLWSEKLLDAYRHGIEYYTKYNTKLRAD